MFNEEIADELIPRVFEVELQFRPAIKLGVATDEVRFEQRHAATDIATDEVRVDHTIGHKRRTDGRAFARMQIRETHRAADAVEFGRGIELAHRFAFDPALGRGEKAHLSFSQGVHVSFVPAKRDWFGVVPEVGIAPTSPRLQRGANLSQLLGEIGSASRSSASEGWSSRAVTLRGLPVIGRALCF